MEVVYRAQHMGHFSEYNRRNGKSGHSVDNFTGASRQSGIVVHQISDNNACIENCGHSAFLAFANLSWAAAAHAAARAAGQSSSETVTSEYFRPAPSNERWCSGGRK